MTREVMAYDVLVVGGGPAGLSAAIRLKQLSPEMTVCLIEKGSEIGAHLLSGAVLEPRALAELFPDYKSRGAPLETPVAHDSFYFLTQGSAVRLPNPPTMHNHGNYIISLGALGRWLAQQAEALGVEIYAGFAGAEILYNADGSVAGVATGDMGVAKDGSHKADYAEGVELRAKQTIFAEGARGSLTKTLLAKFDLTKDKQPQTYSLGVKEIWEVQPENFKRGHVVHTIGWPLDSHTYGGGWCYHFGENKISIGFVTGLDYTNPYLSPFEEMQRYKTHPLFAQLLKGARRIAYGARAIVTGGLQALPKLTFPGGLLAGDTAGFLNVPKIKGNHTAMKSGMLAAEAVFDHIKNGDPSSPASAGSVVASGLGEVSDYQSRVNNSWLHDELYRVRNIKPAFKKGLWAGLAYAAIDTYLLRGKAPWTFGNVAVNTTLKPAADVQPIKYPKPDGVLTFDRLTSVSLTNTAHAENQPVHLQLRNPAVAEDVNLKIYDGPESRYCPAAVYEFVANKLVINAQNCIHCKTCDIKDPTQNINWVTPEGGGGPNYGEM